MLELHPERLRAPGLDDRLAARRAAVRSAGSLAERPAARGGPGDPRAAIRQRQAHDFDALRAEEGRRAAASLSHVDVQRAIRGELGPVWERRQA